MDTAEGTTVGVANPNTMKAQTVMEESHFHKRRKAWIKDPDLGVDIATMLRGGVRYKEHAHNL